MLMVLYNLTQLLHTWEGRGGIIKRAFDVKKRVQKGYTGDFKREVIIKIPNVIIGLYLRNIPIDDREEEGDHSYLVSMLIAWCPTIDVNCTLKNSLLLASKDLRWRRESIYSVRSFHTKTTV